MVKSFLLLQMRKHKRLVHFSINFWAKHTASSKGLIIHVGKKGGGKKLQLDLQWIT